MTRRTDAPNRSTQHLAVARSITHAALALTALMLGLAAAGCGQRADTSGTAPPPAAPPSATGSLPSLAELDSLPLPRREKAASADPANIRRFDGSGFIAASEGVKSSSSGWISMYSKDARPDYAIYAADGLGPGVTLTGWQLEIDDPAKWSTLPAVAIADYARGRWEFRPVALDGVYLAGADAQRYTSPAGRCYALVLGVRDAQDWPGEMHLERGYFSLDDGSPLPAPQFFASGFPGGVRLRPLDYPDLRASHFELALGDQVEQVPPPRRTGNSWDYDWYSMGLSPGWWTLNLTALARGGGAPSATETQGATAEPGWAHSWSGSHDTRLGGIAVLPDGTVLAAGRLIDPDGARRGVLLRFDAAGGLLSAREYAGAGFDSVHTAAAGVFLGGTTEGSQRQPFIARLAADGTRVWARRITTAQDIPETRLAAGPDGTCYLHFASSLPGERERLHLAQFAPDGTLSWIRAESPLNAQDLEISALELAADGDLLAGGRSRAGDAEHCGLLRVTPDGAVRWAGQLAPGGAETAFTALAPAENGGCYAGGMQYGRGVLVRLHADGSLDWARNCGGSGLQSYPLAALAADGVGGVWAAGYNHYYNAVVAHWSAAGGLLSRRCFEFQSEGAHWPAALRLHDGQLLLGASVTGSPGYGWWGLWGETKFEFGSEPAAGGWTLSAPVLQPVELRAVLASLTGTELAGTLDNGHTERAQAFVLSTALPE